MTEQQPAMTAWIHDEGTLGESFSTQDNAFPLIQELARLLRLAGYRSPSDHAKRVWQFFARHTSADGARILAEQFVVALAILGPSSIACDGDLESFKQAFAKALLEKGA